MRYITRIILAVMAAIVFAQPVQATEFMDMDISLGKQIVARTLCKDPVEVNYVSRVRENVYLFSVFYANKQARFFVGVYKDMIRVQGKDFQTVTRSIPYHFDSAAKCAVVDYFPPDCPTNERIVACSQKTIEEQLDEKFWDRPIPELLEEDLRNALADNATSSSDAEEDDQAPENGAQ
ncbi:hypothetical protein [uncultured Pseudodesulfovibrio sp.]|uniref:hypothetical protein n=1 Tax=uncultured Pseudodesulfovibrio sp. TaxID=2035858 RepID=UPI0029C83A2E|nr:hypothetical protein [uncultured Pseudodesulfovibrio sp.]